MHFTPVIPEPPTPEGRSPVQPPVVPTFSPNSVPKTPDWMRSQQAAGPNYAAAYPTSTPFVNAQQMPFLNVPGAMPGMPPGSYFMPSVALPGGGMPPGMGGGMGGGMPPGMGGMPPGMSPSMPNIRPDGFSTDWSGYPVFANASPHTAAGSAHGTPWATPGAMPGATPAMHPMQGFGAPPQMAFQQFATAGWGAPPAAYATPFAPAGAFPGAGWPPGATPFQAAGVHPGFAQAAPAGAGVPAAATGGPQATHRPSRGSADGLDKFDKWSEEPCYGPVLDAFLVKVVKATLELNPLLAPPPEDPDERSYLKWNMLFPTGQCQRSSDPGHRSWAEGRHQPATWPRVKSLRILCRCVPWELQVKASDEEAGVTCGDVIESIHEYMYGRVSSQQLENAPAAHRRLVGQAYWHNRSTAHGVPGGRMFNTLLRCDWLGLQTMFGGIVDASDELLQELACGAALPAVFELKCLQRYPMTEAEIREHRAREEQAREDEERAARRARSRGTSRTTSRVPSRAPSRNSRTSSSRSEQVTSTSDSDEDS
ncbi:hypothetical protein PsYK624_041580 [Phanerochaete sordida]|uniref:DUF6699 domain-containing protein n=1 Tax=Phanerochaete sordida TaxID=48140 RepID=A0A9P3LAD8_9APHY|nr:hypothetical protein PsYK624_041580 [Phanerochaete sordida]